MASLLNPGISPMQIKFAQLILGESGELMIFALLGITALYVTKDTDFSDIYATPLRDWAARFLECHPLFKPIPSFLISLVLSFWLIVICAYPIGMPAIIGTYFLKMTPTISDDLICEAEHWRNLQQSSYLPSSKCQNRMLQRQENMGEKDHDAAPISPMPDMRRDK